METLLILWVLCAGLAYLIARDRAPSRAALVTFLGFAFGPVGVGLAFLFSDGRVDTHEKGEGVKTSETEPTEHNETDVPVRTVAEIKRDLEEMKQRLSNRD